MKNKYIGLLSFGLCLSAILGAPLTALADGPIKMASATEAKQKFAEDRKFILDMVGKYKVQFDMQESTPWIANYTPLDKKISNGHEYVKVIEDTGTKIVLQHLLVGQGKDGKTHVIKHWRQDWQYEPTKVLVYNGTDRWIYEAVPEVMRKGRWSQTVYQVDDSPRYGGWGSIETVAGIKRWRSNWTWRPLPRRDATRNPIYDRFYSINRHQITPNGWIHWQDNTKMGMIDGKLQAIVQEYVLNTYSKDDDYNFSAADKYWDKTKDYWKTVRNAWEANEAANGGIRVPEKAETGTSVAQKLMTIADDINEGKTTTKAGSTEANAIIGALK